MANYQRLVSFLLQWEGKLSKNPDDKASVNPVPDGSGYHTNKGVTWSTFTNMAIRCGYVSSPALFYQMPPDIWGKIMKQGYWDLFQGDKIQSQAIADVMLNWTFMSGVGRVVMKMQTFLGLKPDGVMGPLTIAAINKKSLEDDRAFNNDFIALCLAYFLSLKGDEEFFIGWTNRVQALHKITDSETLNHPSQLFPPKS